MSFDFEVCNLRRELAPQAIYGVPRPPQLELKHGNLAKTQLLFLAQ